MEKSTENTCEICNKKYKNVALHIFKTHNKSKCVGCGKLFNAIDLITELGGKNKNKYWKNGLCDNCFT